MDHTGSEEGKQPSEENGTPSQFSAGDDRATGARSEHEGTSESASRAFELLERFSGELEEILLSLERARGGTASAEDSPKSPERAYRPSSIHFDSSPISTRIDPYALPPVQSPGATSRTSQRILLEVLFLILVAAISVLTGLRPLLIIAVEVVAFLIVASVELAITHDRRRYQQFPASAPAFAAPPAPETGTISQPVSVTLDQVEPLVWRAGRRDEEAEANWPLAPYAPPSEPPEVESIVEAPEGVTEISTRTDLESGDTAAPASSPEVPSETVVESAEAMSATEPEVEVVTEVEVEEEPEVETAFESTAEIPAMELGREEKPPETEAEPEAELEGAPEILATESELKQHRRFGLFRHEASEPESEAEIEPEVEVENEPEVEVESEAELEIPSAVEPEHHRRIRLFRHEASETVPEAEIEPEVETEPEPESEPEVEVENEPEVEVESEAELEIPSVVEPVRHRHFGLFHDEASEPVPEVEEEAGPAFESTAEIPAMELGREEKPPETEAEPEAELEGAPEILATESELKQHRRFGLFHHEASELTAEEEPEVEITPEIEAEAESESAPEILPVEHEHHRTFGRFRHEASVPAAEGEAVGEEEPEVEIEPEVEAEAGSAPEILPVEHEHRRTFGRFRHEASVPVTEGEAVSEEEPEIEIEPAAEAKAPNGEGVLFEEPVWRIPVEEPGNSAGIGDLTFEIDLPPEIPLGKIEQTLENIGGHEPGLRRRLWLRGTDVEKDTMERSLDDERSGAESELRLTAEAERRRREREYLRNLRASR